MHQGPDPVPAKPATPAPSATTAPSRRDFVKSTLTVGAIAAVAGTMVIPAVHAAENNTLKLGLIGCGGRGTGAAGNALKGDENAELYAIGDLFSDQFDTSLKALKQTEVGK